MMPDFIMVVLKMMPGLFIVTLKILPGATYDMAGCLICERHGISVPVKIL